MKVIISICCLMNKVASLFCKYAITLLRSIAMLCGTSSDVEDFPTFNMNVGMFNIILSVPQNIVMHLNNVMANYPLDTYWTYISSI